MNRCLVIGHRGVHSNVPENTLASFEHAVRLGVDMIEFDVRLTRDCVPVIAHDRSIAQILKKRKNIDQIDLNTLQRLDDEAILQNRYKVSHFPPLNDVIESFAGRILLNVELKPDPRREKLLVKEVLARISEKENARVIYSSFSKKILKELSRHRANAKLGVLFSSRPYFHMKFAKAIGAYSFNPNEKICKLSLIEKAHTAGLKIMPWTVNSEPRMRQLLEWGVDGIFTDRPERLISLSK